VECRALLAQRRSRLCHQEWRESSVPPCWKNRRHPSRQSRHPSDARISTFPSKRLPASIAGHDRRSHSRGARGQCWLNPSFDRCGSLVVCAHSALRFRADVAMLSGCATRPAPAIVELNVVFTIVLSRQKTSGVYGVPHNAFTYCRRLPRARLRLTACRPNHARRSPSLCFVGSPGPVHAFGPVVSLPMNRSGL
jgi:hypothetical protein